MKKKDLRYARMVTRIQDLVCQALKEMIEFKCSKTEFSGKIPEFKIEYTPTSTIEEIENLEELNTRLGIATALSDFIGRNKHVNPDEFAEYIINSLLQLEGSHEFFDKTKDFQEPPVPPEEDTGGEHSYY